MSITICPWCPTFNPSDPANQGASHQICPSCLRILEAQIRARAASDWYQRRLLARNVGRKAARDGRPIVIVEVTIEPAPDQPIGPVVDVTLKPTGEPS